MQRPRQLLGLIVLLTLVAIFVGVTGFEVQLPRFGAGGGGNTEAERPLNGVRAVAGSMLLRVGSGAPPGGELAFLAVDPGGNLIVSDSKRHTVMRFDPSGHLLSEWGPRLGLTTLEQPAGVAAQGDNVYVVDRGQPRILRLDASGRVVSILNLESMGTYGLNGLAIDPGGNLYAADTGRNRILVFGANGSLSRQIGRGGTDLGALTQPMMLAFGPDGSFFVADWENNRIARWSQGFEATDAWSVGFHPFGIAVDRTGRLFVPDTDKRRVEVYSPRGAVLGEIGTPGGALTISVAPRQVALARADGSSLYALGGDGIQRIDLENTAPPPQGVGAEVDVLSLVVIALLVAVLVFAVLSRRGRRARPSGESLGATLYRPVRLHAEDGAQPEHQKAKADKEFLIAHQSEGKE